MVGDITQIDTGEGMLFLAIVIDCFSKPATVRPVDTHCPASLVWAALDVAAGRLELSEGAVFYSDRGSQCTSFAFGRKVEENRVCCSIGRIEICFDNAMVESFFGKLHTELAYHRKFAVRAVVHRAVNKCIEGFCNV